MDKKLLHQLASNATPEKRVTVLDKQADLRQPDWRNLLRPRFIKSSRNGAVQIVPRRLSYTHATTLSNTGGPFYSKTFNLPISQASLTDAEYYPPDKKRGYVVSKEIQWNELRLFFRTTPEPGLYVVSSDIRDNRLQQTVFTLVMQMVYSLDCRNVRWGGLYGSYKDDLREEQPKLDCLVIANIHDGMDNIKFTKLKDLTYIYSSIPIILVLDGVDPLEFCMKYLHQAPTMLLKIGYTKLPTYIHRI